MIDIQKFPQRLEITFWNTLIQVMSAAPDLSRFILRVTEWAAAPPRLLQCGLFWSLAGLLLGFALGVFSRLAGLL